MPIRAEIGREQVLPSDSWTVERAAGEGNVAQRAEITVQRPLSGWTPCLGLPMG
jgi:hypothetical protein